MRRMFVLVATVASLLVGAAAAPAAAEEPYPVPYNFLPFALLAGVHQDPPGANDWSCRPSAQHPRPVVLVHGLMGNKSTNWPTYAPLLANNGYCVFALTYGAGSVPGQQTFGGLTRMQDSAAELGAFVAKVLRATGAAEVDLVGHSEGTLMPNYYVKFLDGARFVKRYVSIAPLWKGTLVAHPTQVFDVLFGYGNESTPVCVACGQLRRGSSFLRKMRAGGVAVDGVEYTNIVTRYDQLVVPYTSGIEPGMRNHVLQETCRRNLSEHFQIVSDRATSALVLNALDPQRQEKVPCRLVLPYVG